MACVCVLVPCALANTMKKHTTTPPTQTQRRVVERRRRRRCRCRCRAAFGATRTRLIAAHSFHWVLGVICDGAALCSDLMHSGRRAFEAATMPGRVHDLFCNRKLPYTATTTTANANVRKSFGARSFDSNSNGANRMNFHTQPTQTTPTYIYLFRSIIR